MTLAQRIAQIAGWVFVIVAVAGFFTSGASMDSNPETAPHLLGLFPVNLVHNVVHLLFGVWGIMASRTLDGTRSYLTVAGGIYLLLAVLGFVSPNGFGLVPLGGHDIWLHVVLGLGLLGAGLALTRGPRTADTVRTV